MPEGPQPSAGGGMTGLGKFVFTVLVLGVVGFGGWKWWQQTQKPPAPPVPVQATGAAPAPSPKPNPATTPAPAAMPASEEVVEPSEVPALDPPQPYVVPADGILDVELSDWAGYAGFVVANGGLDPNPESFFAKKHGFRVRIKFSNEESWSALNSGKMAASATTVDVLALYGRQFKVAVPVQFDYSRGADALVVRNEIKTINQLKGRVVAVDQFDETNFLMRYMAQEAGLSVNVLPSMATPPDPACLNLVYCEEPEPAAELFTRFVKADHPGLAGFVGWAPYTTEAVAKCGGKARILQSTRNLLVVADILIVNRGFAEQNPKMVAGLVEGVIEGNRLVRESPEPFLDILGKAYKWDRAKVRSELEKIHFSNLPENLAFFGGTMDLGGSFGGIYQDAVLVYGNDMVKDPPDPEKFADLRHLKALEQTGTYRDQKVVIQPIKVAGTAPVESNPLLSKNIRFLFQPNSADLDLADAGNQASLADVLSLLRVAPGATLTLRGHVDNSRVDEFRKSGGEQLVRNQARRAIEFSKQRANEVRRILVEKHKVDAGSIDTEGKGWEQPLGSDPDQNRRVEILWFTLE